MAEQDAGADSAATSKKGTGVFFGPAVASRLSRSRGGPKRSSTFSGLPLFGGSGREGSGKGNACGTMPPASAGHARPRRRASMEVLVSGSSSTASMEALVSTRDLPIRAASFTTPSCYTPSPGILEEPADSDQARFLQFVSQLPQAQAIMGGADSTAEALPVADSQPAQLQFVSQSEQQHLQESQQLQAQLEQLLQLQQQQQLQMQLPPLQQQLGRVTVNTTGNSTLLSGAAISAELAQQLQVLQQPGQVLGGNLSAGQGAGSASSHTSTYANASGLLQQEAFGQAASSNFAAPLSTVQGNAAAQQLQLQLQASLPQLQEETDAEEAQVAALDGLINRCVLRLLQLRQQISGKKTTTAGSSCSATGLNPAVLTSEGYAAGQVPAVSSPFFLLQQQTSSTLTPQLATTFSTASGAQQQQLLRLSDSGFAGRPSMDCGVAGRQSMDLGIAGRQSMDLGFAGMPSNKPASVLAAGSTCNLVPSASRCGVSTPSPTPPAHLLLQLQSPAPMLTQQQSQLLLQQVTGSALMDTEPVMQARFSCSDHGGDGGASASLPNSTLQQGMVLSQAGQQPTSGGQELLGGWSGQVQGLQQLQELQQLQQLLASQQLGGRLLPQ